MATLASKDRRIEGRINWPTQSNIIDLSIYFVLKIMYMAP